MLVGKMSIDMKNTSYSLSLVGLISLLTVACDVSVNRSLNVNDGETRSGGLTTVNGKIRIGNEAVVSGTARTVNGGVTVGSDSKVESLETVNGSIKIGTDTLANGSLETVNGSVTCERGAEVKGEISTINGAIKLTSTNVDQGLSTVNGDIRLSEGSTVNGSVKFTGKSGGKVRDLKLTLSGGSVIKGDVVVKNSKVRLSIFLLEDSRIEGSIPDGIEPKLNQE